VTPVIEGKGSSTDPKEEAQSGITATTNELAINGRRGVLLLTPCRQRPRFGSMQSSNQSRRQQQRRRMHQITARRLLAARACGGDVGARMKPVQQQAASSRRDVRRRGPVTPSLIYWLIWGKGAVS